MAKGSDRQAAWGRIGGLKAWAHNDAETMLGAAWRAAAQRWDREVDPLGVLPADERARRSARARKSAMLKLALRSAEVRKVKAASGGRSADAAKEVAGADGEIRRQA